MLKRLIEVALPLKEVSEQSAREKSIRHGHISTLHIWWARRPLAACRAVLFASLIPDPDDPECPDSFRTLVNDELRPIAEQCGDIDAEKWNGDHQKEIEAGTKRRKERKDFIDQYRDRTLVLEFIKLLVRWENSNNEELIGKARKLIAAAHKFLHPDADGEMPKVLDPFAGGGAIPLEALRLGCDAHAIDLNPVAHIIELCTLVYPQKYGQPNSRPTPDYIKNLEAAHRGKERKKQHEIDFDESDGGERPTEIDGIALTRLPLITEAEYQKNPLVADVKFWGHWVLEKARDEIGQFYPLAHDGNIPVAYLWARTVKCPNPACGAVIPLIQQSWLCKKATKKVAARLCPDRRTLRCSFTVAEGKDIDFDPSKGTMAKGKAACPFCDQVADGDYLRTESKSKRMGEQLMAVVELAPGESGKRYRSGTQSDTNIAACAGERLAQLQGGENCIDMPHEPITPDRPSPNSRGLSGVARYGFATFGQLFNPRQSMTMLTLVKHVRQAVKHLSDAEDRSFSNAVGTFLGMVTNRAANQLTSLCRMDVTRETLQGTYGRQALPMIWDYAEVNPLGDATGGWIGALEWVTRVVVTTSATKMDSGNCYRASATAMPMGNGTLDAVVTDPPYYDSVPYADLSDFFYVWLKRSVGGLHPEAFRTPLTPKQQELIAYYGNGPRKIQKLPEWYEHGMAEAFAEVNRVLGTDAVCCVMFAHKTTSAWESAIAALIRSGLAVTSSWPLHTEMKTRMVAQNAAALASSVTLVCRKRLETAGEGYWDDVRNELREVSRERLDFFWQQEIRGADFFISAIGPALSVYGRYAKVTRLTGEEVSVGQFLDEVRGVVTDYALSQILHGAKTGQIDSETRFYVLWKWSYGDGKVAADEAFKLSQALGIDTEEMWDRTGVLEKQGQNVQALTVAKRMRIKDLGEPNVDGSPATLIDTLHRCCSFRDKGDTGGLSEYLARSGHGRNEKLWTVAQAISEVLPDGDKEKQLLQGLLNQRDKIDEAMAEERLF